MKMFRLARAGILPALVLLVGFQPLPALSDQPSECIDDNWTATSTTNAPTGRLAPAVWTGSEMIVWGGSEFNTGGRYNPSTDSWTATTTTNAPTARYNFTVVWTGTEMIVWGGQIRGNETNTGGRYNPSTNSWTPTSTIKAPLHRYNHTAVWTGSEMIVWGGFGDSDYLNTGGRYNPSADTWTATSTTNAPAARESHTAVWTGGEMIVWGGFGLNTGGRYNPDTDSWTSTAISNAPTARDSHTAVWTNREMIVWGGYFFDGTTTQVLNTGGRYNPGTDSWTTTSTSNAPAGRFYHTTVWTNREMIVWGGIDNNDSNLDTGGRYNPGTDSWTATNTTNAPASRNGPTAVWTDSEMIVWGGIGSSGYLNTGGRYCAQSGPAITLDARVRRQGAKRVVVLTWSPADGGRVTVSRDNAVIGATDDDGEAQDNLGTHTGTFTYQVCETDSGDCSNIARITVRGTDD